MKINEITSKHEELRLVPLVFEAVDLNKNQLFKYFKDRTSAHIDSGFIKSWPSNGGKVASVTMNESSVHEEITPIISNIIDMGINNIKVGSKLSLLDLDVVFAGRYIEVRGFTTPKKVISIKPSPAGNIKRITFDDGSIWPQSQPATYQGKPIEYVIFFNNNVAVSALTYLHTALPKEWNIDRSELNESVTESESYSPPTLHTGDVVMKGKFKNSPVEIKGFKKDKHNQPVLKTNKGDVQLFKPRITKLMKENEWAEILSLNGKIPLETWCNLAEQYFVNKTIILETIDDNLLDKLKNVESSTNASCKIGSQYVPVPIFLVNNIVQAFDSHGNFPPTQPPQFLTLIKRTGQQFTFASEQGEISWPDARMSKVGYMTVLLASTMEEYSKIRTWLSLTMNVSLPE